MMRKELSDVMAERQRQNEKAPVIGRVTKVYEKEDNEPETGNIEVNVQTKSVNHELRRVPVLNSDHPGHVSVPQKDEYVIVDWTMGQGRQPIVVGASFTDKDRSPDALAGHWRHEFELDHRNDNLYLEAEPSDGGSGTPDTVRMGVKGSGVGDASTEIAVDASGQSTEVKIDTDGDIHLNADGDILIGDEGNAEPVARADHVHDFEYTDSDETGSTSRSGTTDEPNGSGTETRIE